MPTHHASHFPLFRLQDYCTLVVSSSSLRFPSSRLSSDRSCLAELAASAISLASRSAENRSFACKTLFSVDRAKPRVAWEGFRSDFQVLGLVSA